MDTHADTCCAGANWTPMHYTGEICEVSPFLNTYAPLQETQMERCCTVWTDEKVKEYILVDDEMLWFGTALQNSLIKPNQIRDYGILINDDPFNANELGITAKEIFIPFDTTEKVVHFKSRVPTEWEITHLPVILITADLWDPATVDMSAGKQSREDAEMRMIRPLVSSASKRSISATQRDQSNFRQIRF